MKKNRGFTLIEVSLVLLIVALTLSSLLFPLGTKLEQKSIDESKIKIKELKRSVLNFVMSNYRLPCPDIDFDGREDLSGTNCTNVNGSIPYVTLRSPHSQDPWGQLFAYRVSAQLADTNNINACGVAPPNVSIAVCSADPAFAEGEINVFSYDDLGAPQPAAIGVAAIILSTGRNTGATGDAQVENMDNDTDFAKTNYGGTNASVPFNDIVAWIAVNELIAELIHSEVLP